MVLQHVRCTFSQISILITIAETVPQDITVDSKGDIWFTDPCSSLPPPVTILAPLHKPHLPPLLALTKHLLSPLLGQQSRHPRPGHIPLPPLHRPRQHHRRHPPPTRRHRHLALRPYPVHLRHGRHIRPYAAIARNARLLRLQHHVSSYDIRL